jgi:two-component system alkaline phosphatase synthesis response regulator PhoP
MEIGKMKKKILVMDDDFILLELLKKTLEKAGYDVTAAESRLAAEEALLGLNPDLAILDLIVDEPDSGFIVAHEIKQLYPATPMILLTAALGSTGLQFDAQNREAKSWVVVDKVMDKPVRPEQLLEEIHALLHEPAEAATH